MPSDAASGDEPGHFINRELSWLEFNARVLDQAHDRRLPLLERVKFLAIFGSNLDEFFMVRVSGLHDQLESKLPVAAADGLSVLEQLAGIRTRVLVLVRDAASLLQHELLGELAAVGLRIVELDGLPSADAEWARGYFRTSVFPVLTPLSVDPGHPFPFLSNLSLSLAVEAREPDTGERRFIRLKVPESLPRFVRIGGSVGRGAPPVPATFVPLEELIAANLADLLPGLDVIGWYPFRVTRDMDLEVLEDEADDLLAVIDRQVRERRLGAVVRLEVSPRLPPRIRAMLVAKLEIDEDDVYEYEGILGISGLFALSATAIPALRDPPLVTNPDAGFHHGDPFAVIAGGDVLVHHPRDPFEAVVEFLRRAADDPDVLAVKMTLYRAGAQSELVRLLIRAAENGKQVAVSLELKARFDEAINITLARTFGRAGVHVFFGSADSKTHAKILLVVRREGEALRRYVHVATGNYNAVTARLYTDLGLFTADEAIGEDASHLFNMLSGSSRPSGFRRLVVAPMSLRATLLDRIEAQAERAGRRQPARIFAKMNSLVDDEIIRALYAASSAGVDIELVVRGICCLRPGVPGLSERIRVLSLLGRFLEHERVTIFGPVGEEEMFIGSADWMPRNLGRRVELMIPILDDRLRERIRVECTRPLEHVGAVYQLEATGAYRRLERATGDSPGPTASAERQAVALVRD